MHQRESNTFKPAFCRGKHAIEAHASRTKQSCSHRGKRRSTVHSPRKNRLAIRQLSREVLGRNRQLKVFTSRRQRARPSAVSEHDTTGRVHNYKFQDHEVGWKLEVARVVFRLKSALVYPRTVVFRFHNASRRYRPTPYLQHRLRRRQYIRFHQHNCIPMAYIGYARNIKPISRFSKVYVCVRSKGFYSQDNSVVCLSVFALPFFWPHYKRKIHPSYSASQTTVYTWNVSVALPAFLSNKRTHDPEQKLFLV